MGMCKPSGGKYDVYGPSKHSLPKNYLPNSRIDYYDEKTRELLQQRWYDPNGLAILDRDWKHYNNPQKPHKFPHDHPYDWSMKIPRYGYDENRPINIEYC